MTHKIINDEGAILLEEAIRNLWMSSDANNNATYNRICKWLDNLPSAQGEIFGYVSDTTYSVTNAGTVCKKPNEVFKNPVYAAPQLPPDAAKRIAELEEEVSSLKAAANKGHPRPDLDKYSHEHHWQRCDGSIYVVDSSD